MKIYSDFLTEGDLYRTARQVPGLYLDVDEIRGARVRARGWTVRTSGDGNRWKNSGKYGADTNVNAASWDQYGFWFARLYAIDPNARIVFYGNAAEFHKSTKKKYGLMISEPGPMVPEDNYA